MRNSVSKYIIKNECASWMSDEGVNSFHYVWKRRKLDFNPAKAITIGENWWFKASREKKNALKGVKAWLLLL